MAMLSAFEGLEALNELGAAFAQRKLMDDAVALVARS